MTNFPEIRSAEFTDGAALRETLGGEAFRCECSGVAEKLKALVRRNGRDDVRATELDESSWCW